LIFENQIFIQGNLINLKKLGLKENYLESIPEEIGLSINYFVSRRERESKIILQLK
jgi:hypothetical protein